MYRRRIADASCRSRRFDRVDQDSHASGIEVVNALDGKLDISQYPAAWAEYRRRWLAAWAIPLTIVAPCILGGRWRILVVVAVIAYVPLYVRFVHWPCPRCGLQFTMPDRVLRRAKKCMYCGLPVGWTADTIASSEQLT